MAGDQISVLGVRRSYPYDVETPKAVSVLGRDTGYNKQNIWDHIRIRRVCLIGCMEENRVPTGTIAVVLRCFFQARKLIAQNWQAQRPLQLKYGSRL